MQLTRDRIATTGVFLAAGWAVGAWAGAIPAIKQGLALSDAALSLALLAFTGGALLGMPVAGWLGPRFGDRCVMLVAGACLSAALILPGLAGSLAVLAGCAAALGLGLGTMDVAMNAHASGVERAWGRPIMSSFHAAFSVGGLLGAAGMAGLLSLGVGLRGGFVAAAVLGMALVAGCALLGQDAAAPGGGADLVAPHGAGSLPRRALLGMGALAFLSFMIEGGMADWSGVFLATVAGTGAATAALGFAAFSVAMAAGRLAGDWLVRHCGGGRVLVWGAAMAGCGLGVALATASPGISIAAFALVGLGLANVAPVLFTAAGNATPARPSAGVAVVAAPGYAGLVAGPPIIGLAAEALGLQLALVLLVAACLAIAAAAGRALRPG